MFLQTLSWFPFSLAAVVLFGVSMAFYKFPSVKKYSKFATTFWTLLVSVVLAFIFFFSYLPLTTSGMLWLAFLWGISFPSIMLLQMYALEHVDTNVLFPVTTTASLVVTVLVGIFAFGEYVTLLQGIGISLAVATVFLFLYKGGTLQFASLVLSVGSAIIFVSAFNKVLQKIVADSFDIHAFQIYQYLFATLISAAILFLAHRKNWKQELFSGAIKIGSIIGVFGFLGGYALFIALTKGPFPLVTAIHSLYIFVTALAAYLIFKEELTARKMLLIALAVAAVLLIRLG